MKRNAFGQLMLPPHIRFVDDGDGGGGDGEFKPPANQEELDKLINGAVARAHRKYEPIKAKAEKWDEYERANAKPEPKPQVGDEKPGISPDDVDKRIQEALAAKDRELAEERVSDRLDKALEGRAFSASKLFSLDRSQFVKEDGKSVDLEAIQDWVEKNSTEIKAAPKPVPGQGARGDSTEIESGRSAYARRHPKKN